MAALSSFKVLFYKEYSYNVGAAVKKIGDCPAPLKIGDRKLGTAPVFSLCYWAMNGANAALVVLVLAAACEAGEDAGPAATTYAAWKNGPPSDPDYFPIAVWLQDPRNAARFKAAGINL